MLLITGLFSQFSDYVDTVRGFFMKGGPVLKPLEICSCAEHLERRLISPVDMCSTLSDILHRTGLVL